MRPKYTFLILGWVLLLVGMTLGGIVFGQGATDCDPNYIILRQVQISSQLEGFTLQAEVNPDMALDQLYTVMEGYRELLETCGYFDTDPVFDLRDIGDPIAGEILFNTVFAEAVIEGENFVFVCASCHETASDETLVGPSFVGVTERVMERLEAMTPDEIRAFTGVDADAPLEEQIIGYLYTSVVRPEAYISNGRHETVMPRNWAMGLSRQQTLDIIAYLLTVEASD